MRSSGSLGRRAVGYIARPLLCAVGWHPRAEIHNLYCPAEGAPRVGVAGKRWFCGRCQRAWGTDGVQRRARRVQWKEMPGQD